MNFNVWENYTMRYNRVKHRKASFVSFKRILYEILLNDQKASSLLVMSSINVCIFNRR